MRIGEQIFRLASQKAAGILVVVQKTTTNILKASVAAVKAGSGIADETAESLLATVDQLKS